MSFSFDLHVLLNNDSRDTIKRTKWKVSAQSFLLADFIFLFEEDVREIEQPKQTQASFEHKVVTPTAIRKNLF